jgi:hypothetical protein
MRALVATTVAPTTPPPSVAWIDNGFDTPGLPAVTADGTRIIAAEIESDGGRGYPNLRIVARDRSDAIVEQITILKIDEVDTMFDKDGQYPKLRARISAANTWLANLHRTQNLMPLPKLQLEGGDAYAQHTARAGAVQLDWSKDLVTIRNAAGVVATHPSPATWQAAGHDGCSNPAKLGGAWVDLDRKLALVEIAYNGTDTCWEPSSQRHVISW